MTDADWLRAILGAVGVIVISPWVAWISRTAVRSMSREEHQDLCEHRDKRLSAEIAELKAMIQKNDEEAVRSRHQMGNRVTNLALQIATLPGYRRIRTAEDKDVNG